jgi:cell division protein FtsN
MANNSKAANSKKNKPSSSGLTRKGLIIWISLTFVASAWMFVLGIIVGRGTAPVKFDIERLQKELALLRETGLMKELRKYKINSGVDQHTTEMGFYETLKDTRKEVGLQTDKHEQADKSLPEQKNSETKKALVTKTTKPKQTPATTGKIAVGANMPESKPFTIQVASLRDISAADRMVAELQQKGIHAYKSKAEISGKGTWYRVRVGAYTSKAAADSTLAKLKKKQVQGMVVLK